MEQQDLRHHLFIDLRLDRWPRPEALRIAEPSNDTWDDFELDRKPEHFVIFCCLGIWIN